MCRAVESEDATETEALLSAAEQGQAGTGKFFYFTTFVQAALIVHELHLLDLASLRQVTLCIMACTSMYLNVLLCTLGCISMYLDVSLCILLKEALPNYSANLTEKSASSKICIWHANLICDIASGCSQCIPVSSRSQFYVSLCTSVCSDLRG